MGTKETMDQLRGYIQNDEETAEKKPASREDTAKALEGEARTHQQVKKPAKKREARNG